MRTSSRAHEKQANLWYKVSVSDSRKELGPQSQEVEHIEPTIRMTLKNKSSAILGFSRIATCVYILAKEMGTTFDSDANDLVVGSSNSANQAKAKNFLNELSVR